MKPVTKNVVLCILSGILITVLVIILKYVVPPGDVDDSTCHWYLAPSSLKGAGFGIFAGRDFKRNELLSSEAVVYSQMDLTSNMQLNNYVYSATETHVAFAFGLPSLANHHRLGSNMRVTDMVMSDHTRLVREEAYSPLHARKTVTTKAITAGSEIFNDYHIDTWFEERDIKEIHDLPESTTITLAELEENAQCLSHLYFKDSDIAMAGKGVFSKVAYKDGASVDISPALVLSKHLVQYGNDDSVLLNYCISEEGSDAAIFPISSSAMMNHGGTKSNIRMEWYTVEGDESHLDMPIEQLEAFPFAPLSIRYVATRPIAAGEELLLDYGDDWSQKWLEHLDRVIEWNGDTEWSEDTKQSAQHPKLSFKPQFREPIRALKGFFPENFKSTCIAKVNCPSSINRTDEQQSNQELYLSAKKEMQKMFHVESL